MKKLHFLTIFCAIACTHITMSANAALVGRLPMTHGGTDFQAAYDTVLDITWVTDAALGGGKFNHWDDAVAWASNLDYLGFDDWRLASMSVAGDNPPINCKAVTELSCRDNELDYMYRYNLDFIIGIKKDGTRSIGDVTLSNIEHTYYSAEASSPTFVYSMRFSDGKQVNNLKNVEGYGWAVRDGDINVVPVPAAAWLFGSGLLSLVVVARRK